MAQQAEADTLLLPHLNELIRSAQRILYLEFKQTRLAKIITEPLLAGVGVYDWPDDSEPGVIQWIYLINDEFNPTDLVVLQPGIRPEESIDPYTSVPFRYDYIDREIHIVPAPAEDTSWTHMRIRYFRAETPLSGDDDEISVDEEALVRQTVIQYKENIGEPTQAQRRDLDQYLLRLMNSQSVGGRIHLGGNHAFAIPRGGEVVGGRLLRPGLPTYPGRFYGGYYV
jgi:hypothetical protein